MLFPRGFPRHHLPLGAAPMASSAGPPPAAAAFTSDLREVARVAAVSRVCVVALAVLADLLLPDHLAQGALEAPFEPSCAAAPLLRAFTRWDAAHFLRVAQHGWRDEWSYAFFPLYPLLLRSASGASRHLPLLDQLCEQERTCTRPCARAAGASLCREGYDHMHPGCGTLYARLTPLASRSGSCSAACCLYALGVEVLRDRRLAWLGALLFCCSPASVFFSSLYTESRHPPLQPKPAPSPWTHPEP